MHFDRETRRAATRSVIARLLQNFLQGAIVLAPIGVTIWAVLFLFNAVDDILPNILHQIVPTIITKDPDGSLRKIPGLGFIVVIILVMLVGWISSLFVFSRIVAFFDGILEKTPGIKFIYTSVKDLMEAFAGNKKKFDKPVLVNIDGENIWRIGFITQQSVRHFDLEEHVAVYVPHSYAISGITFFVPPHKIKVLDNVSAADAMKFAISGGVTDVY